MLSYIGKRILSLIPVMFVVVEKLAAKFNTRKKKNVQKDVTITK